MKKALLALSIVLAGACVAEAQVKSRWKIEWNNEKPQLYTYRTANDNYENFWYVHFTLENRTDEIVPLIVDLLLYTESGKELQHDVRRVDLPVIKDVQDNPRKAESLKYGRFYANVIDPEVEYKIIEYHAKLGNRSQGIVTEGIKALKKGFLEDPPDEYKGRWKKGDRMYLNPADRQLSRDTLDASACGAGSHVIIWQSGLRRYAQQPDRSAAGLRERTRHRQCDGRFRAGFHARRLLGQGRGSNGAECRS